MSKILCPYHDDTRPSLEVYEDGYYCFVCGVSGPLQALKEFGVNLIKSEITPKREPIDLEREKEYIDSLPVVEYRGFHLRADEAGVYITWPDSLYYKKRLNNNDKLRYMNPTGHPQPLFWANRNNSSILFMVEGEINAMSLSKAFPGMSVCSPGGAQQFKSVLNNDVLTHLSNYSTVILVVDRDAAGTLAAIEAKVKLKDHIKLISIIFMDKDCNEVMLADGIDGLKETILKQVRLAL